MILPAFDAPCQGTLEDVPLATLLCAAADRRATGQLRLSRGRIVKSIFIVNGHPRYVDSNVRSETLGAYLVDRRVITDKELGRALVRARANNSRLGQALIELNLVDRSVVDEGLVAQIQVKIVSALRWQEGSYVFAPGDDFRKRVPNCAVAPVRLVLAALERFARTEDVAALLQNELDNGIELTDLGIRHARSIAEIYGEALAPNGPQRVTLRQRIEESADGAMVMARVEALRMARLLCFVPLAGGREADLLLQGCAGQATPTAGVAESLPNRESSATLELRHLDPTRALEALSARQEEVSHSSPTATTLVAISVEGSDVDLGPRQTAGDAQQQLLMEAIDKSEEQTLYEMLEVPATASRNEIESAYCRQQERLGLAVAKAGSRQPTDMHEHVAGLLDRAVTVLCDDDERQRYDGRLAAAAQMQAPSRRETFGAELFFQQGQTYLEAGDLGGAVEAFRSAVDLNPEQGEYYAYLGWALFLLRGRGVAGAVAARVHLQAALQLAPDHASVHELASRVEEDVHNFGKAAAHLRQALKVGLPRSDLFCRLKDLLIRQADYGQLEQVLRHMVFRLRDDDPAGTLPLWLDLAALYAERLGQRDNAELALRVARKLQPQDERIAELAMQIAAMDRENVEALADRCRHVVGQRGGDATPLHDLFWICQRQGRQQMLSNLGGILAVRGDASEEQLALLARVRKEFALERIAQVTPALQAAARHPADRIEVEELVAELAPLLCETNPLPLEAFGSRKGAARKLDELPPACAGTLDGVARALGVSLPELYVSTSVAGAIPHPDLHPALILAEPMVLAEDQRATAFYVARALTCLGSGRRHVLARTAEELRGVLVAAISACYTGVPAADADGGKVALIRSRLERDGVVRERLTGLMDRMFGELGRFNLSDWIRSVRRTSARLALLVCRDAETALHLVQADAATAEDLAEFALSPPYMGQLLAA